jgi:DNA-binding LytR/AlgR family response regulator
MVSIGLRRVAVEPSEVEWFAAAGNYLVVNWQGREGLLRETVQALASRLDPPCSYARTARPW